MTRNRCTCRTRPDAIKTCLNHRQWAATHPDQVPPFWPPPYRHIDIRHLEFTRLRRAGLEIERAIVLSWMYEGALRGYVAMPDFYKGGVDGPEGRQ